MFAARVRASLKALLHGRHISSLSRNCEIAASSKRALLERFNGGELNLNRLRVTGNGERTKLFNRAFHCSSTQCYSSESDVGAKNDTFALFSSLEYDVFSELGCVEKDGNRNMVVELLTKMPETSQVEIPLPEIPQKTKGNKKKKKDEQASDSISKPKLLTEKPEASWKTNGKSKAEALVFSPARNVKESFSKPTESSSPIPEHESKAETHASSPERNVTESFSKPTESSYPIPEHEPKAQSLISPSSEAKNKTSSNGSSTSNTTSSHPSSVLVIRIGNLNSETTDSKIHSTCLSIGSLEGHARVSEDSVDVLFRARNVNEANSILEKLNEATVDHSQWTAEIVSEAEEASRDQMGMKVSRSFEDIGKQLRVRHMLVKDLEFLVHSVIHLENHPMAREGTKALQCSQEA